MSLFLILALLTFVQTPGSGAGTPVFVPTGADVNLDVPEAAVPQFFALFLWRFKTNKLIVRCAFSGEQTIGQGYSGRIEDSERKYSLKLKNVTKEDSGTYTALVTVFAEHIITEYDVTVEDPVSPVELSVSSVSQTSSSCDLSVTCSTTDAQISSSVRCDTHTCDQEGGERAEVTNSGASLLVRLSNLSIICNHSNHISWTENVATAEAFCFQFRDVSGVSICQVKTVLFSMGLIIMVSAVITVHLMEKLKKK